MLAALLRDLTHAVHALSKARAFTFVCVVSLGIGMAPVIAIPYVSRLDLGDAATGITLIGWIGAPSDVTFQATAGSKLRASTMFVPANYFKTLGVALAGRRVRRLSGRSAESRTGRHPELPENMGISLSNAEPIAYVVGPAIAVLVAVLASLGPARRAASVQPMVAMRSV
jgi:ABC-type antimicrobial peptide transport system permease subunit